MRICTLALLAAFTFVPAATAADGSPPVEGTLFLGGKTVPLKYVVAYESRESDETRVSLVFSDRRIPVAEIKKELDAHDGSDRTLLLSQPYLRLVFKDGKPASVNGAANNTSFGTGGEYEGSVTITNGIATGHAKLEKTEPGPFQRAFDLKFNVPFGLTAGAAKPAPSATPPKPSVTGTFKGNGKAAKLSYVSARPGEPFADKPSILLVFSEKDHTKDPKPDFNASFGKYGSALIINLHDDGSIFGCQVAHSAHQKGAFSSVGAIHTEEFDVTENSVAGKITTGGEQTFFSQTWDVDITFAVPLNAAAARIAKVEPKTPAKPPEVKSPAKQPMAPRATGDKPASKGASLAVNDLPFLKDAKDVNYKKIVGMLDYKSSTKVTALAAEIQKGLTDNGWQVDGAEIVNPNSTILRRKSGDGELTIFIKPSGTGSEVKVMSKGLDWSKVE
ncbi:MAG TPA: hypothetical protein VM452_15415 [Caulifigura sp.]|nr:hypothetical protein [Caulifigura sp.]